MRAVLVRDGDYFVSHRKRMEIAHEAHADFFISIHADSYRDADAKGATVYVLSDKGASDEAALLLAQRENASDLIGGVSLADKDQMLARVLLDLSQSAALSASTAAGQRLIRRMSAVTAMRRREVQQAPFLVLKSPDIPSVLVETAYISNPREEASLRSAQVPVRARRRAAARHRRLLRRESAGRQLLRGATAVRRVAGAPCGTSSRAARRCRRSRSAIASAPRASAARTACGPTFCAVGQVLTIPRG